MGQTLDMLNNIRENGSEEYQQRIPVATQTNLAEIGQYFETYAPLYNEFCEALVNKIGKTIIEQKISKNRLAKFKKGRVSPHDVEEIFIENAKAEGSYDPKGPNPLGRREGPDVKVVYHRQNRQDYYCISLGDIDFSRVFRSESTLEAFIDGRLNSVYSGANRDEFLIMKNMIGSYKGFEKNFYEVPVITDANAEKAAKTFVKTLRKAVLDFSFDSTEHNDAEVLTSTEAQSLCLLVNKDVLAEVDVEVLAKAMNMGKTDIQVEIVPMDDFGGLENTYGILCDKDWFRVYDTKSHMEPQRNAQGLFTNWFYHIHQIHAASPFKNAVQFKAVSAS